LEHHVLARLGRQVITPTKTASQPVSSQSVLQDAKRSSAGIVVRRTQFSSN